MIKLRASQADLRTGSQSFLGLPDPVIGYERGEDIVCIFNLSKKKVSVELPYPLSPLMEEAVASLKDTQLDLGPNGFVIARRS
ncbi:MAG: hypothetical protein AAFR50_10370 [Pseudomonadota bacterium]